MKELEERIISLEEKFSYQDDIINELNIMVANHELTINILKDQIKTIQEDATATSGRSLLDDVPPHY
jgi:uncharacterized coiled-coil protein SlyX